MKPIYEQINTSYRSSFHCKRIVHNAFDAPWHYHPEFELTYIIRGEGIRYVGDHAESFTHGDLVLLGPNLPHYWKNPSEYLADDKIKAEGIVVQFDKEFMGADFFDKPEMFYIEKLLEASTYGLAFEAEKYANLKKLLTCLPELEPLDRFVNLLEILKILADIPYRTLCSSGFLYHDGGQSKRLDKVMDYISKHFKSGISENDVANHINISASAFSRYFRKTNKKTFIKFLNEYRIGYACKLLIETTMRVTEICFESGFNNLANFNRQFLQIVGKTPTEYRQGFRDV